jgi:predicted MFS family arabinose efflux permease
MADGRQMGLSAATGDSAPAAPSAWSPFHYAGFAILWTAAVVANIGTWMYSTAAGWLMTSLNADPLIVSLVQVATNLPMLLFALPAGALADIVDRRRFLIAVEAATTLIAAGIAAIVWLDLVTPSILLLFTFLLGAAAALTAPAWQAVVPQLVPKDDLPPAVAANSAGINVSRAVGPALGGATIAALGIAAPFWLNTVSNLGIISALAWWRSPQARGRPLPAERFVSAIRSGFRYSRHNPHLRATLVRAVAFFLFASAYWALLPLIARHQITGGPELYGILLGTIGASAVCGTFALPWLKAKLGPDRSMALGTLGTATTLVLFGLAHGSLIGLAASVIAGASWITVLANLNVSAQVSLPDWVRGRGLAMFVTVFYGAMTVGSAAWGQVAGMIGLPGAMFIAAAGAIFGIPLTWRWKLQTAAGIDLSPSMHWPAPVITHQVQPDRGPVLVTVEYRIKPADRKAFLIALERLGHERRRDGAYAWQVFEDSAEDGRFLETFLVESWLEHLRQHERVTNADRMLQEIVDHYHAEGTPKVTHFIAAEPDCL